MTKYLISFPSSAMSHLSEAELHAASEDSRAVVRAAKEAGVWVFGGALDDGAPPLLVAADGSTSAETYPERARFDGGFALFELPDDEAAVEWAARIAAACRCPQDVRPFHFDPES
ncbi:transcription initiation protein [Agromyces mediolanus]|uniref:transcription initiation protein n=1 Tax=Agromyces mediolanus TaxID=41986 RepID=UPI0038325BCF